MYRDQQRAKSRNNPEGAKTRHEQSVEILFGSPLKRRPKIQRENIEQDHIISLFQDSFQSLGDSVGEIVGATRSEEETNLQLADDEDGEASSSIEKQCEESQHGLSMLRVVDDGKAATKHLARWVENCRSPLRDFKATGMPLAKSLLQEATTSTKSKLHASIDGACSDRPGKVQQQSESRPLEGSEMTREIDESDPPYDERHHSAYKRGNRGKAGKSVLNDEGQKSVSLPAQVAETPCSSRPLASPPVSSPNDLGRIKTAENDMQVKPRVFSIPSLPEGSYAAQFIDESESEQPYDERILSMMQSSTDKDSGDTNGYEELLRELGATELNDQASKPVHAAEGLHAKDKRRGQTEEKAKSKGLPSLLAQRRSPVVEESETSTVQLRNGGDDAIAGYEDQTETSVWEESLCESSSDSPADYARHLLGIPAARIDRSKELPLNTEEEESMHMQDVEDTDGDEDDYFEMTLESFYDGSFAEGDGDVLGGHTLDATNISEMRAALASLLEEERAVESKFLSKLQVSMIMELPKKEMREVLEHFNLSKKFNRKIRWDFVEFMIKPRDGISEEEYEEETTAEEEDDEDDDDGGSSFDGSVASDVQAYANAEDETTLGSGFSLHGNPSRCESSVTFQDLDDLSEEDIVEILVASEHKRDLRRVR